MIIDLEIGRLSWIIKWTQCNYKVWEVGEIRVMALLEEVHEPSNEDSLEKLAKARSEPTPRAPQGMQSC